MKNEQFPAINIDGTRKKRLIITQKKCDPPILSIFINFRVRAVDGRKPPVHMANISLFTTAARGFLQVVGWISEPPTVSRKGTIQGLQH